MNISIPSNATTSSIKMAHVPPRGATHFRFTSPGKRPVIDKIKNLDTLAGCDGKLEYGSVQFEGRGRYAKVISFTTLATVAEAEPIAEETEQEPVETKNPKGRKNRILGFSACSVAKALGAAGVEYAEADRIFRAHGIKMSKASLSVQLGFGRNPRSWERHGKCAELSKAQIADLRAEVTK